MDDTPTPDSLEETDPLQEDAASTADFPSEDVIGSVVPTGDGQPLQSNFEARPAKKPLELPSPTGRDQLRLAASAMIQRGVPLEAAAAEYSVDPDTLHRWHRTYINFIGKDGFAASSTGASPERIEIDPETSLKFDQNWDEMMRLAELDRPQLSPFHQAMLRSPFTRWMFRGEQIDKITVIGAVCVLAFSALAIRAATTHRGTVTAPPPAERPAYDPDSPIDISDPESFEGAGQEDTLKKLMEAVMNFSKLETWQERLPHLRDQEKVGPLMAGYYEMYEDAPLAGAGATLAINPDVSFIKGDGEVFVLVQAQRRIDDSSFDPPKKVIFFAEIVEEEPFFLFDWEILVNYSPIPFPDFVKAKQATPSPFRVRISRGDYYNQPFMDSDEFASYAINPLLSDKIVHGFVRRGTPIFQRLEETVDKQIEANRAMILNLRFPDKAKYEDILIIDSIKTEGWLEE